MQGEGLSALIAKTTLIETQLGRIKIDIQNHHTHKQYPKELPSSYIQKAIQLKLAFKDVAEGIEGNRQIGQLQKEKIQKSKVFLEGFNYYKQTLNNKIGQKNIELNSIEDYLSKPLSIQNWLDYQATDKQLTLQLQAKKKEKQDYETSLSQRTKWEKALVQKKELYQKIVPSQAKILDAHIQKMSRLINITQFQQLTDIKSTSLQQIYDRLSPLSIRNWVKLNYLNEEFQEIEVVISSQDSRLHQLASINKINIPAKQIKLIIADISPHHRTLIIGLDRREDYTNEQVFNRLIANESIQPVFTEPQNELQRNFNTKYVRLGWVQSSLANGMVSGEELLQKIKQRVFSLQLMTYLIENIKKVAFFNPLQCSNEVAVSNNIKKLTSGTLEKIGFKEYLKLINVPSWIQKYSNNFKIQSNSNQIETSSYHNFLHILKVLNLQEFQQSNLNNYYHGTFSLYQNKLEFLLIIPTTYPHQSSHISLLDYHLKKEDEKKQFPLDVPCKNVVKRETKAVTDRMLHFETEINQKIKQFCHGYQDKNPFRVMLQLNRLLSLMAEPEKTN